MLTINGVKPINYTQVSPRAWQSVDKDVIEETPITLFINGHEWVTLMCTPVNVDDLVVGFLAGEGVISSMDDVSLIDLTHRGAVADVWLRFDVPPPQRRVITSGCVGGVTFIDLAAARAPVTAPRHLNCTQVFDSMTQLQKAATLYNCSQGVHTSALSDGRRLLAVAEDVGRHNTLDKIRGRCLRHDISTDGGILLSTGRISSEMLRKAADMNVPVIISRTSPTSMSVALAEAWNMTIIGYVRGRQMRIYTAPWRVALESMASNKPLNKVNKVMKGEAV